VAFALFVTLSAAALLIGMLLFAEIGRRIGVARFKRDPDGAGREGGAAEAAVFGLLGLLVAFTFSGAASRFHDRRLLIAQESNAIGTAYLRVDLLPADAQPEVRELFRKYVELRATVYRAAADDAETQSRLSDGASLQRTIWRTAVSASQRPGAATQAPLLLLPALNEMFDITTTRAAATQVHPPGAVFLLLGALCLVGALLIGHGASRNAERRWFYPMMFAAIMAATVFVIVDIEYPRLGLIRVDAADQILLDLRQSMQ
jgi:hypothetical protein